MSATWMQREGAVVDGQFHLGTYIGGSGRGAVFHTTAGEYEAAIKLIPADSRDAEFFIARWKHAVHLNHPHLMRMFRTGRYQLGTTPMLYAVMEFAGENLGEILPGRALTPEEAREMLEPVLDALSYLHRQGFAHARLKPSNIMVVDEKLKLSSDGLLRLGEFTPRNEKPGPYDPPEMGVRENTPAADIWSLGITLVETLTRQLPVHDAKTQEDPALPDSLPQPFREIARRSLRLNPEARCSIAAVRSLLKAPPGSIPAEPARAPVTKKEVRSPAPTKAKAAANQRSYIVSAIIAALIIAAIYIAPRLMNRQNAAAPASPSAQAETPTVTPASTPANTQPTAQPEAAKPEPPSAPIKAEKTLIAPPPPPKRSTTSKPESKPKPPPPAASDSQVLSQVMPEVSQKALDTIQGKVRILVKLSVDASGSVTQAELNSPSRSQYFSDRAIQAARQWKFAPAAAGQSAASDWLVQFDFHRDSTKISSKRISQ